MIKIDPLAILLLSEACLILLGLTVYGFINLRRLRARHAAVQAEREGLKKTAQEQTAKIQALVAVSAATRQAAPAQSAPAAPGDDATLKGMINKLQRIVDYQKTKLLDLMTYIEILEQAQENLTAIQRKNHDLQERMKGILKAPDKHREFSEVLVLFDQNTASLETSILSLRRENQKLTETFRTWEEELKKMWEEEGCEPIEHSAPVDPAASHEKAALVRRVQELEKQLAEKSAQLDKLRLEHENLEQEYLILYKRDQETRELVEPSENEK